ARAAAARPPVGWARDRRAHRRPAAGLPSALGAGGDAAGAAFGEAAGAGPAAVGERAVFGGVYPRRLVLLESALDTAPAAAPDSPARRRPDRRRGPRRRPPHRPEGPPRPDPSLPGRRRLHALHLD